MYRRRFLPVFEPAARGAAIGNGYRGSADFFVRSLENPLKKYL
jgi:hypothetical protein